MTVMDYHHRYNVFPEYYCPTYQGSGYSFLSPPNHPPQGQHPPHRHRMPYNSQRNFNNNIIGYDNVHYPTPHLQPRHQHPQNSYAHYHQTPQNQHRQNSSQRYSSPYMPNFLMGSGSGLTPTLTPTTLATIEQSLVELQNSQQNGGRDPVTQSGFVPPVVDTGHSAEQSQDSYGDYTSSDDEPSAKRGRMSADIKDVNMIQTANGTINATPQRKYTRRNKDEKLPPEEEQRRRMRRERNKQAAAKCRQRRVDHTNELVEETEQLEDEQSKLEAEIQALQQEREQLEFILQAHQPICKVNPSNHLPPMLPKVMKREPIVMKREPEAVPDYRNYEDPCPVPENLSMSAAASSSSAASTALSSMTTAPPVIYSSSTVSESSMATTRPNSLPLIKRDHARMMSAVTGVSINTPTSGVSITPSALFCPGLDSIVDGSTGLTPLTGLSCSSQVQHRNHSESSSEPVGSPNLISL